MSDIKDFDAILADGTTVSLRLVKSGQDGWNIDVYEEHGEDGSRFWGICGTPLDDEDSKILEINPHPMQVTGGRIIGIDLGRGKDYSPINQAHPTTNKEQP